MHDATHKPSAISAIGLLAMGLLSAPALAAIGTVAPHAPAVDKYAKLELTVGVSGTYKNPYDPDEVDLSAEFISPSKKAWRVNGFYDGTAWKVRFAANEVGTWSYTVRVKDAGGTSQSVPQPFACNDSKAHGWVRVAPNKRYLACDDGTSFYGVGSCYAWSITAANLDQMKTLGFNTFVYWNGTYDQNGGNNLIESMTSGLGKYDQRKCARVDQIINWSEARGLGMVLVILPHDYGCEKVGTWPAKWSQNPYSTLVASDDYYRDAKSWSYQEKQYRYIIARWGYSTAIRSWQTVDEISGTNGWVADQASANAWTEKIGEYFQTQDPFRHPTTASHGSFWDEGNKANDLPNTEIYGNYATGNIVSTVQRLWNGYEKPCIMGETGAERNGPAAHRKLWAGLAAGISVTPLLWQFNEGWDASISAQYPAFNKFIADLDFAGLKHPAQAKLSVPGMVVTPAPATATAASPAAGAPVRGAPGAPGAPGAAGGAAGGRGRGRGNPPPDLGVWGITSDQLTFGWMTGPFAGKNLRATVMANGAYTIQWWDSTTGAIVSTANATVTDGTLTTPIVDTPQTELAFKIIGPAK